MSGVVREDNIRVRIQAISELPEVADSLAELIRLTKQQQEITQQAALSARTSAIRQEEAIKGVTTALKEQGNAAKKAGDDASDGFKKANSDIEGLANGVRNFTSLLATAFSLHELKSFAGDVIDAKTQIDTLNVAFATMLGSKREASTLYAQITDLAKKTPFDLNTLADEAKKLLAYNVSAADIIPTLTNLGNIAAAVGTEKLPQITLAYGQIMNMGKLMGGETKQLIESGIDVYGLLSISMGKTRSEVQKMAADHTIMASDVKKAFEMASAEGGKYAGMMEKISKTVGGEISNLGDIFFQAKGKIGDFFENQIRSGTKNLSDLIEAVAGSESAIKRSITTIGAAVSGWVAARTALNLFTAQKLIDEGQTDRLTLSQRILTVSTESMAAASATAAGGLRALWAAFAANPLGAVITLISLAASAWMSYDAATQEVMSSLGEQQKKLEFEKSALNGIAQSAMNAAEGSKLRKDQIANLIEQYPDYFSGLDKEKTTNEQLQRILDKVNLSYTQRIALAREAYNSEQLDKQQGDLLDREQKLLASLPDNIRKIAAGSASNLLSEMMDADVRQLVNNQRTMFGNLISGSMEEELKEISNGLTKIEQARATSAAKVRDITTSSNNAEVVAIKEHFNVLREQANGNSQEIQRLNQQEKEAIAKINKTSQTTEVKNLTDHAEKLKSVTLLSAKEIALLRKQNAEDEEQDRIKQLRSQLDYIQKQEDAEIESVNKIKVNKKISKEALAALEEEGEKKITAIIAKHNLERAKIIEEIEKEEATRFLEKIQKNSDEIAVLTAKRLEAEKMLAQLNNANTHDERLAALKVYNDKYAIEVKDALVKEAEAQKEAAAQRLEEIAEQNGERGDAYRKAYADWLEANKRYETAITNQTITSAKETAEEIKKYEQQIQEAHKETFELEKDTLEKSRQNRQQFLSGLASLLSQEGGFFGQITSGLVALYNGFDSLNLKSLENAKTNVANAKKAHDEIEEVWSDGSAEGAAKIAEAERQYAKAKNELKSAEGLSASSALSIAGTVYQILSSIATAFNEAQAATYRAIAEGLGRARQSYKDFYDFVTQNAETAHQREMESFSGSIDERIGKIREFYDYQKQRASAFDTIDATLQFNQRMAEINSQAGANAKDLINGVTQARAEQTQRQQELIIQLAEIELRKAQEVRDARIAAIDAEFQAFKDAKQKEIDTITSNTDKAIQAVRDQLEAARELYNKNVENARKAYDEELQALRDAQSAARVEIQATFDLKRQLLEQSTNDEIDKITILSGVRNEVLERYRKDQTDMLIATRDRILATLTDENDRMEVTNDFARRIKKVHDDVEEGKLNTTKGVSLATIQLRNEEKTKSVDLKNEEKTEIEKLDEVYQQKFKDLATERDGVIEDLKTQLINKETILNNRISQLQDEKFEKIQDILGLIASQEAAAAQDRLEANAEFARQEMKIQKAIFEAQKRMKVAELTAQKAILNSQKGLFSNNSAINAAMGAIDAAIGEISSLSFDTGGVDIGYISSKFGKVAIPLARGSGSGVGNTNPTGPGSTGNSKPTTPVDGSGNQVSKAFDENGNEITLTYDPLGHSFSAYDANKNAITVKFARGKAAATGKEYFDGTDYLELGGNPSGRDTIPVMANEGERILPTADNLAIGGKGLSNSQLVDKIKFYDRFAAMYPNAFNPSLLPASDMFARLRLPDSMMKSGQTTAVDVSGLRQDLKAVESAIKNQKHLDLRIDKGGFYTAFVGSQSTTEYVMNQLTQ